MTTNQNLQKSFLLLALLPLSIWGVWRAFRNESDPLWRETADLLRQNSVTIGESPDSLRSLYNHFHPEKPTTTDSAITRLIAKPYMPNMAFSKFQSYAQLIYERKFLMVSGVTGAGNSTLVDRIANRRVLRTRRLRFVGNQIGNSVNQSRVTRARYARNHEEFAFKNQLCVRLEF